MPITKRMYKTEVLHAIVAVFVYIFISTSKANAVEVSPIFGIGQENFTFELSEFDPNDKNKKINFAPNIAGIAKLGINAYGFGVGYSFRGAEKDINQNKGTTKFDDWQLAYNSKNWGIETFYQTYTGFYTENTNAIQVNPNLTLRRIGITARYALGDEEFSVGALMDQTSRIKETSGKYYLIAGYDDHTLKTDSSLLIQENAGVDPTLESLRQLKANDLKFGVGAGKYWVFAESFFESGTI